jgi:hypothetical protein
MEMFVIQMPIRPKATEEGSRDELRGVVEHVGSGRRRPFVDTRDLLAFLHAEAQAEPKEVER